MKVRWTPEKQEEIDARVRCTPTPETQEEVGWTLEKQKEIDARVKVRWTKS